MKQTALLAGRPENSRAYVVRGEAAMRAAWVAAEWALLGPVGRVERCREKVSRAHAGTNFGKVVGMVAVVFQLDKAVAERNGAAETSSW